MASARTRVLLAASVLAGALLFGGIVDRAVVGGPAWDRLGPVAWAAFSRHADLGAGLLVYPAEAIGATLLTVAAIVSCHIDRAARSPMIVPMYFALGFYLAGLLLTFKAAPIMLGVPDLQSVAALHDAYAAFRLWGLCLRGAADGLALLAGIGALTRAR
jgi:hypothetical protein